MKITQTEDPFGPEKNPKNIGESAKKSAKNLDKHLRI